MIKFFKSKIYKVLIVVGIIYAIYIICNQQVTLNAYAADKEYYEEKIESLESEQEELLEQKENVDSLEYIEEMAREKLDMYYPNEKVFVDISK